MTASTDAQVARKRVLDVGNCQPDHASIRRLVEGGFGAKVVKAHGPEDALAELRRQV